MMSSMNPGFQPPGDAIFLVKCADCKCLAVRGADGRWKSFYDDAELPDVIEVVIPVPFELILPFLPNSNASGYVRFRLPAQT